MAARWLHSRVLPFLASRPSQSSSIFREHFYLSSSNVASFNINEYLRRRIQTQPAPTNPVTEEIQKDENCSSSSLKAVDNPTGEIATSSGLKVSSRHDLAMVFTCKVCETRSVKTVCRESYEKGVVVVRCGGCNNHHLIADRLGWYGEPGSIEDLLAARGEGVKKGNVDSLNLTLEDLAGNKLGTVI